MKALSRLLILLPCLWACAPRQAAPRPQATAPHAALSPDVQVREQGRLTADGAVEGLLEGRAIASWRVRTYGATTLSLRLAPTSAAPAPTLLVAGPLPDHPTQIVATLAPGASRSLTLPDAGAWRLLVGTPQALRGAPGPRTPYRLELRCESGCAPVPLSLQDAATLLHARAPAPDFPALAARALSRAFAHTLLESPVAAALTDALTTDPPALQRLPLITLPDLRLPIALMASPSYPPPRPRPTRLSLPEPPPTDCTAPRPAPAALDPRLPGLTHGPVPDHTLDDCTVAATRRLAALLDNLALGNGSVATLDGTPHDTVRGLFRALLATDHRVILRTERLLADPLGLQLDGRPITAPLWLDIGLLLPGGDPLTVSTLTVPTPHARLAIHVDGPLLRADLTFTLHPTHGASFQALETVEPAWTGPHAYADFSSDDDPETVLRILHVAARLRLRWIVHGLDLPALGFGELALPTDAIALLELAAGRDALELFPLAHRPPDAQPTSELDALLSRLAPDLDGFEPADALRRMVSTLAPDGLDALPFPDVSRALRQLTEDLPP